MGKYIIKTTKSTVAKKITLKKTDNKSAFVGTRAAVVGGGWFGVLSAIALKNAGFDNVTLYEAGDLAEKTSGKFSGRAHKNGYHYLRSEITRKDCVGDYELFSRKYSDAFVPNKRSIYGLVYSDAQGNPSKVNLEEFQSVYKKDSITETLNQEENGFTGFQDAFFIEEESIKNGSELREMLRERLVREKVNFYCSVPISNIEKTKQGNKYIVVGKYLKDDLDLKDEVDVVVNATGFQSLVPKSFDTNPFEIALRYQACLGLQYIDTKPEEGTLSFIALDGANPCLMSNGNNQYLVTHAAYTVLATCEKPSEAEEVISLLEKDSYAIDTIRQLSENDLMRYYPHFCERFKYNGWRSGVIAKPLTNTEYRSAFSFQDPDGVIHVFPGKIINAPRIANEVVNLALKKDSVLLDGYSYIENGSLACAIQELSSRPTDNKHNSCLSNPYPHLLSNAKEHVAKLDNNASTFWKKSEEQKIGRSATEDITERMHKM